MDTEIKKLRCGSCGETKHELYVIKPTGEVLVECITCWNVSIISVSQPKISIDNHRGNGCIAVF